MTKQNKTSSGELVKINRFSAFYFLQLYCQ